MSYIKKLAGQTAIYGLSSILGRFLNYLLTPILTRVFMPDAFGVNTEFFVYAGFLNVVYTYGMETAFFRYYNNAVEKKHVFDTAFISLLVSSLLLSGPLLLFDTTVAGWADYPEHPEYVRYFACILAFDTIAVIPFSLLRAQERPIRFAVAKLVTIFSNIGFTLFFLLLCPYILQKGPDTPLYSFVNKVYDPAIGVGYIFIATLYSSIITLLYLTPKWLKRRYDFDMKLWKQMLPYALPVLVAGLAGMTNEMMSRAMLKYLSPLAKEETMAQLGIFGAAYKLSIIMTLFIQAYRMAAEPFFFSQSKREDATSIYASTNKYFIIFCSLIFLFTMLFMDVFKYFIGNEGSAYHEGLRVVPILLMANLWLGVYYNLSVWYKMTGKTSWGAGIALVGALITVIFNFILIPFFGYYGASWVTLLCYFTMAAISYYSGQKYYPIPYEVLKSLLYPLASVIVWYAVIKLSPFDGTSVMRFALNVLVLLLFAGAAYYFEKRPKLAA